MRIFLLRLGMGACIFLLNGAIILTTGGIQTGFVRPVPVLIFITILCFGVPFCIPMKRRPPR